VTETEGATKRRVPQCLINWCCPYRSELCRLRCTGERLDDNETMIVRGNFCYIRSGGLVERFRLLKGDKERIAAYDSGE